MDDKIENIIEFLDEMKEEDTVPKNVKLKIADVIGILKSNLEESLKIDKVMHIFDELNEDSNLDSFTRTQLWNVVSMLESI
ncbi:UPF0147 family protein [Candidatus Woesearchaeota archaeon]|nr:UPF0147 family protein [Candidatus Woesearchaeota archaeon]